MRECEPFASESPQSVNTSTEISYELADVQIVTLKVFDVSGAHGATLFDVQAGAGMAGVRWDGREKSGRKVLSGLHFYRWEGAECPLSNDVYCIKKSLGGF